MSIDLERLLESNTIVFLYFKNETCQPCKVLRIKVEELIKQKFPEVKFYVLDIVNYPNLVSKLNVLSSPTMLLYIENKEYFRGGIYTSISELEEKIGKYYKMLF